MPEMFRTRDVVVLKKGVSGWAGGQGVSWASTGRDELSVAASTGLPHGFLLWGSDESPDQFTSMTRNQPAYQYAVLGFGGWVLATRTYERYTLASRTSGPLVPLVYPAQARILMSLRGLFTIEDEWTLSSDPRGANTNVIGVVARPSVENYLTLQLRI